MLSEVIYMSDLLFSVFPNENFFDLGLYQYGWRTMCAPAHSFGPARNHYIFHYVISGTGTFCEWWKRNTITWQVKSGQRLHAFFRDRSILAIADSKLPWEYTWVNSTDSVPRDCLNRRTQSDHPVWHARFRKDLRNEMMNEMLYITNSGFYPPIHRFI